MGKIVEKNINVPIYNEKRKLRVYLPEEYFISDKSYPVLYMHDGQNVFRDSDAAFGVSLKMEMLLNELEKIPQYRKTIVVALDNSEKHRYDEYSPWNCEKPKSNFQEGVMYGGKGEQYAQYIAGGLREYIGMKYRILEGPQNTAICGCSMGGFITAYMAAKYPQIYGKAGVFSIASWFAEKSFLQWMNQISIDPNQRIFIQVGTRETSDEQDLNMNQTYINNSIMYFRKIIERKANNSNIYFNVAAGDEHNEKSWSKHMIEFLMF